MKKRDMVAILERANLNAHPQNQYEAYRYIYAHVQEYTALGRESSYY